MKYLDLIKEVQVSKGINKIELDNFYSIGKIDTSNSITVRYFVGNREVFHVENTVYANILLVDSSIDQVVKIYQGLGFHINRDYEYEEKFQHFSGWTGGDGIYSFNLTNGEDQLGTSKDVKTLFVFGDTFFGRCDRKTYRRYEPLLMPNNTLAYLKNGTINFKVNRDPLDNSVTGYFSIDPKNDYFGYVARNLVTYNRPNKENYWMSAKDDPNEITLIFDLYDIREVTHIYPVHYQSIESPDLSDRSIDQFKAYVSNDGTNWNFVGIFKVNGMIPFQQRFRYFKLEVIKSEKFEQVYALDKFYFYNGNDYYRDIDVKASSVLLKTRENAWLWLQDGVVIDRNLYFLPMIIVADKTQPEGLQFRLKDVLMIKVPINQNDELDTHRVEQKMAPLIANKGLVETLVGGAIMSNTKQSGAINHDGYIYIYGFHTTFGHRAVIVARVLADRFEYFDDWRYFYEDGTWGHDLQNAKVIFTHSSCEFSVSELNKNQYIAFFTYDVNTKYKAYSLSPTPWGPFSEPIIFYEAPEVDEFKATTYTYNGKAHPHLSDKDEILFSYNVNTYSFEHNMSDCRVYRPRFIKLKTVTK